MAPSRLPKTQSTQSVTRLFDPSAKAAPATTTPVAAEKDIPTVVTDIAAKKMSKLFTKSLNYCNGDIREAASMAILSIRQQLGLEVFKLSPDEAMKLLETNQLRNDFCNQLLVGFFKSKKFPDDKERTLEKGLVTYLADSFLQTIANGTSLNLSKTPAPNANRK